MKTIKNLIEYKRKIQFLERENRMLERENRKLKLKIEELEKYKRWSQYTIKEFNSKTSLNEAKE